MKNILMLCLLGVSLVFGACAHKPCGGCKEGSCKMEHKDKKECGCDHSKDADKKSEEKK